MSILNRISILFRSKVLHAVDQAEDPRETLDYACERHRDLLANVRRALVEVATAKHQLAAQAQRLEQSLTTLQDQARRAVASGRDDLARQALERRQVAQHELDAVRRNLVEVTQEQDKLQQAERRFAARVDAFRQRRDLLSARYTAAQAQAEAGQALAGVSGDLADLGAAVQRAGERIERTRASAFAVDELLRSGILDDLTAPPGDRLEQELHRHQDQQEIEEQLARLKGEQPS